MQVKLLKAFDAYQEVKRRAERSDQTLKGSEEAMRLFVRDVGDIELQDLTTQQLQDHLVKCYPKASTRKKRQRQLSAFLNWCTVKREWIPKNPARALETITLEEGTKECLVPEELEKLRKQANQTERTAIEYLLFLRDNEFLTADPDLVNPEAKTMRVHRGKLHKWANIEATDEMIEFRGGLKKWGGPKTRKELDAAERRLQYWFRDFAKRAGMPEDKRIPLIIRHTGATMYAAKYRDPFRLMNQMGWRNVQRAITYVHQAERSAWAALFPRIDMATLNEKLDRVLDLLKNRVKA